LDTSQNNSESIKRIIQRIRKYEIKLRKQISGSVTGEIKSFSKGSGIEFDDVRPYQWGDDVRAIDWNVTAKGQGTYIKTFKEYKDQSVWVLSDLSSSTLVGKRSGLIKELSGLMMFCSLAQGSNVGFIGFSDKRELFLKPTKSKTKVFAAVNNLLAFRGDTLKTDISNILKDLLVIEKKKSLVMVISDFEDDDFLAEIKHLSNKHEVVLIDVVKSGKEKKDLPLGIIPSLGAESGRILFSVFKSNRSNDSVKIDATNKLPNVDRLSLHVGDDYVDELANFFRGRKRRR